MAAKVGEILVVSGTGEQARHLAVLSSRRPTLATKYLDTTNYHSLLPNLYFLHWHYQHSQR